MQDRVFPAGKRVDLSLIKVKTQLTSALSFRLQFTIFNRKLENVVSKI
jgi:hypothetical protein